MHLTYIILSIVGLATAYAPIFGTFSSQACQNCIDGAFNICVGFASFAECLCLTTGLGAAQLALCASPGPCAANTADVAQILFGAENYCVQYYPQQFCTSPLYIKSVCATAARATVQAVTSTSRPPPVVTPTTSSSTTKPVSVASTSSQTRATSTTNFLKASTSPSSSSSGSGTISPIVVATSSATTGSSTSSRSASASFVQVTSGAGATGMKDGASANGVVGVCVLGLLNLLTFFM